MIDAYIRQHYPDLLLTRFDALRFKFGVYRTGETCEAGHRDFRRTDTGACIACIKEIGFCISCKDPDCKAPRIHDVPKSGCPKGKEWTDGRNAARRYYRSRTQSITKSPRV